MASWASWASCGLPEGFLDFLSFLGASTEESFLGALAEERLFASVEEGFMVTSPLAEDCCSGS